MLDFSDLLIKHQDSFIYVDNRKKTSDILKQLVDLEEKPIDFLPQKRIELLENNLIHSIHFDKSKGVSLKLFFVIDNGKSRNYYQHPYFIQSVTDPFLQDKRIYIFLDESVGMVETNSSLLGFDAKILSGISPKSVEKKDSYFMDYISAFELRAEINKNVN